MQNSINNFSNNVPVSTENLDQIKGGLKNLGENATGGIWSKFKAHAAKAMTRPGATRQAVGVSALILGGLAKLGLLAGIGAALGTTISFPPAAIGVALVGGALLLAWGSYKVYQHAKEVAQQKAQDSNQNVKIRDIALEFVKQTADNIIFGVPALLVKFLPGIKNKLESCAEKYEAKQGIKEGALSISEQIGNLKNLQGNISGSINTIKNAVNERVDEAKTKIQNKINEKAKEILNEKINNLTNQLNQYNDRLSQLNNLKDLIQDPLGNLNKIGDILNKSNFEQKTLDVLRGIAEKNLKNMIDNPSFSDQKLKLEAILNRLNAVDIKGLQKIREQLDLGLDTALQNLETGLAGIVKEQINSLNLPANLQTLKKTLENTKKALEYLNDNKSNLEEEVQTILNDAKTTAKEECKKQINDIKDELKQQATTLIESQKAKITDSITHGVNGIEQKINGAFATLEKTIGSTELGLKSLIELKTHTTQKIDEFKNLNLINELNSEVSTLIDSFDFEQGLNLDQAFETTTTKINNLTESLAEDAAKHFIEAGIQEAKEVGAHKVEATMNNFEKQIYQGIWS